MKIFLKSPGELPDACAPATAGPVVVRFVDTVTVLCVQSADMLPDLPAAGHFAGKDTRHASLHVPSDSHDITAGLPTGAASQPLPEQHVQLQDVRNLATVVSDADDVAGFVAATAGAAAAVLASTRAMLRAGADLLGFFLSLSLRVGTTLGAIAPIRFWTPSARHVNATSTRSGQASAQFWHVTPTRMARVCERPTGREPFWKQPTLVWTSVVPSMNDS